MKLGRPIHLVVLLTLIIAASYAFGDPICVTANATTDIPPPRFVIDLHAINTFPVQAGSYWMQPHGFSIANANRQSSILVTPIRFSERDRYKEKKNRDRKTAISVPEPSGIQLLGIGFIGVVFVVRKFRP